ncbi:MAG: Gmad2 immunoglobulin-like domain-containing protein [Actinomycetota bacterium]|nr:Gmad2 immunoglobulin-like domain-containing protein [Actinomycetota bacterium]
MNRELDSELGAAVRSEAESVQPTDRLGEIRARTQNDPAMQWWRLPLVLAGGAALVAASVVVGAVLLADPDPADPDPPMAISATREVTVFELGQVNGQLWLYPAQVTTEDTGDPALDAVLALSATGWHPCTTAEVQAVEVRARLVTVAFGAGGRMGVCLPDVFAAQAQQLAWTVRTATESNRPVRSTSPDIGPVKADPEVLSPVLIESPADEATVSSPVRVSGTSDTFEANVQWEVRRDGEVVDAGFTSGGTMGERGPFRFTVDLPPATYTVRAYATSPEDGRLVAEDTKTFTVR